MNTIPTAGPTTGPAPLEAFDSALVGELRQAVVARSAAPGRRSVRRPALAAAAVLAAAATAFGLTSFGTSAAYAVERTDSGDIRIAIHRLDDAAGLEKTLASYGIDAKVDYQADGPGTALPPGVDPKMLPAPGGSTSTGESGVQTIAGEATAGGSSGLSAGGPASACGDLRTLPLTAELSDHDYVITIPKGSVLTRSDTELQITTSGSLADSVAGLKVDFTVDGVSCGFGSMSAGAQAVPAN